VGDEQRVRTMAGWIGVEISRSRVRTAGKAGYGLYRVRGLELPKYPTRIGQNPMDPVPSEWTAYAFTLEQIERAVQGAIREGSPNGPAVLRLRLGIPDGLGGYDPDRFALVTVPTRWTTAYRGRRDLGAGGEPIPEQIKTDLAAEVSALGSLIGAGVVHVPTTPRQRQRADNAAFQAEHLERRAHGLRARYAAKMERSEKEQKGS
jgi:hypothetical protein